MAGTTEILTLIFSGAAKRTAGQGRFFYIKSATAALTITCEGSPTGIKRFVGVGAGTAFLTTEDDKWRYMQIESAVAQTVELVLGDDEIKIASAVSIVGGVFSVPVPFVTFDSTVDTSVGAGAAVTVPANGARRALRVGNISTNLASFRVGTVGAAAANQGEEIQPGMFGRWETTAAVDVFNTGGVAQSMWIVEEI